MNRRFFLAVSAWALSGFAAGAPARLAFVAEVDNGWRLFTCGEEGRDVKAMGHAGADARLPDWFQDRTRLVFTTNTGIAYVVAEESGRLVDSVKDARYYFWQAATGAEGDLLYLVASGAQDIDRTFLLKYDFKARTFSEFLKLATPVYYIDVSPASGDLLFANNLCGAACGRMIQEIWLRRARDGHSAQTHLLNAMSRYPSWLPGAEGFLFETEAGGSSIMMRQSFASERPVPWSPEGACSGGCSQPAVSPDGARVAYLKEGKLHVAALTGSGGGKAWLPFPGKPGVRIKDPKW